MTIEAQAKSALAKIKAETGEPAELNYLDSDGVIRVTHKGVRHVTTVGKVAAVVLGTEPEVIAPKRRGRPPKEAAIVEPLETDEAGE